MDSKIQVINVFNKEQDSYNENELNLIPFEPLNRAENITKINEVFNVGDENQLLSISNNQIKAKSILKFYQVVDNAGDLETCKNNTNYLIYDLQNNQILEFKNGAWVKVGTPDIEDNILIFNKTTKKLFYYNQSILVDLSV